MITASIIHRAGHLPGIPTDCVSLDYEGRFLRRKRVTTEAGADVLVDLPETVSLNEGDAFETETGLVIEIVAAPEALLKITGDLTRLAWHIGNRHTPCQIESDHLLIRADHVLADMVVKLGGSVDQTMGSFVPEGGAYGHGRTHGH